VASQEDFLFAEHVLRRGFATEDQVQVCLKLLDRLKEEMRIEETLPALLLKKGYIAPAQATVVDHDIHPEKAAAAKNQIQGYRLLSRLGAGAMGSVYKAHHLKLDILVALKVLRAELGAQRTQVERLKREAQLAARLNHPNLVRAIDVGESNGFHYIAMEFVDGTTARDLVEKRPLKEKEALRIVGEVAKALAYAHAHGVVHRDVKPGNIMVTKAGEVKLADLGLARGAGPSDLTLEHASIGTPQYLAPEQARRGADATHRSDLFSLGATLYHLVAGRPPFQGENLGEIFGRVLRCDYEPPEAVAPGLQTDTVYLIHRLMRPRPKERYADANELLRDLERLERGERIAPRAFRGDFAAFAERRRRRRIALLGAGGAAAVAAALLSLASLRASREERRRMEDCARIDRTLEEEVRTEGDAGRMRGHLSRMREAAGAGICAADEIAGLRQRIALAEADAALLEKAEGLARRAREEGAAYRALLEEAKGLGARLEGARRAADALRLEIAERSVGEARRRQQEVYARSYATIASAKEAIHGLDSELQTRFLPTDEEWARQARLHAIAFDALLAAWEGAERTHGEAFAQALREEDFRRADEQLSALRKRRLDARRAAALPAQFLAPFEEEDPRLDGLRRAEREAFQPLRRRVEENLGERPWEAERLLREFRPSGETQREVADLLAKCRDAASEVVAAQTREVQEAEATFFGLIETSRFRRAARQLDEAQKARLFWIPAAEKRFAVLARSAERFERLLERWLRNPKVSPAPGDDPDAFLLPGGRRAYLRDVPLAEAAAGFAFDDASSADHELRGYFYLAMALGQEDRRETARLLERAAEDLSATGAAFAEGARDLLQRERERQGEREREADLLFRELEEANQRGDASRGIGLCEALLGRLRRTDIADARAKYIEETLTRFRQLDSGQYVLRWAAIPPSQFAYDPETGFASFVYDFRPWHPHEGKVPADRLEESTRNYWRDVHAQGVGPEKPEFELFLERARRQLLDFSPEVRPHPDGGALFSSAEAQDLWWRSGSIRPASVACHADPARDWAIDLVVSWEAGAPVYFGVAAGRFEGGILLQADPRFPKLDAFAARIFPAPADRKGVEREMEEARRGGARRPDGLGGKGALARVRFARKGDELLLFAAPADRQDRATEEPVARLAIPPEDRRAPFARFEIYSHEACRLHRVETSGTLASAAAGGGR